MDSERWRRAPCWFLAAAIAANGVAAGVRARNEARRQRQALTESYVDFISLFEAETDVARLRARLDERGYIEYVSDVPNARLFLEEPRFLRFTLFQYGIAPTILGRRPLDPATLPNGRPRRSFLLADFAGDAELDEFLARNPCEVRWRRGGIALLRRR